MKKWWRDTETFPKQQTLSRYCHKNVKYLIHIFSEVTVSGYTPHLPPLIRKPTQTLRHLRKYFWMKTIPTILEMIQNKPPYLE